MKQITYILFIQVFLTLLSSWVNPQPALAQNDFTCGNYIPRVTITPQEIVRGDGQELTVPINGLTPGATYEVKLLGNRIYTQTINPTSSSATVVFDHETASAGLGPNFVSLHKKTPQGFDEYSCQLGGFRVLRASSQDSCSIEVTNLSNDLACGDNSSSLRMSVRNAVINGEPAQGDFDIWRSLTGGAGLRVGTIPLQDGNGDVDIDVSTMNLFAGTISGWNGYFSFRDGQRIYCRSNTVHIIDNADVCNEILSPAHQVPGMFNLCNQAAMDNNGNNPCTDCLNNNGIWTALGCLPTKPADLLPKLAQFAVGIAGGIALMLMLIGAFRISVSAGNPDNVQAGKDMFTSAVAGLLLIIFSALILRIVGVDIFQLPGF